MKQTTEPTAEQIAEMKKLISKIIQHNGNVAYRQFSGNMPRHVLPIVSISSPIQAIPTMVEFIDTDLIGSLSANDVDNPDAGKEKQLAPLPEKVKPVVKRASLKIVK